MSTEQQSWSKSCCLSTTSPQHQALVSSPQASTHADKSMLCFPESEVFTRRVNAGSKTFYMRHYTARKNLHATEMKLDQRRSKQHHRRADKGAGDNPHWPFSRQKPVLSQFEVRILNQMCQTAVSCL